MIQAETPQNDEIHSADDSEPDYFGEYDNMEDSQAEERVFTVEASSLEGRKASTLNQLADELIWVAGLRVFEGTDILEYVEDYGYYRRVPMPEIMLSKRLGPPGYFARLSAKDIGTSATVSNGTRFLNAPPISLTLPLRKSILKRGFLILSRERNANIRLTACTPIM